MKHYSALILFMKPLKILDFSQKIDLALKPLVNLLAKYKITANEISLSQLPFVFAFLYAFINGHQIYATAALGVTLFLDLLDGSFARITGTATKEGHLLDKVLDLIGIYAFLGAVVLVFPQFLVLAAFVGILNAIIYLSNYYVKPELYFGVRSFGFVGLLFGKLYLALILTLLIGLITLSYKIYKGARYHREA